jgi:hypothetical protein
MSVLAVPAIHDYLEELVVVLYEKGYFGYEEHAIDYVNDVINFINTQLTASVHREAPKHYERYGKKLKFATYRRNRHTHWYIFFNKYKTKGEIIYMVRYIGNNHTEAQYLYEGF